jgi:beta-fructofuranosidase
MNTPVGRGCPEITVGQFRCIYDPSVGEEQRWYINDHTLVRAADGGWHLIGITHPEPADPENERLFAHASAPALHGPWTKHPPRLTADPDYGETHLWAPHVVGHDGRYAMIYAGGGPDPRRAALNLATSSDLHHWSRHPGGPLFRDGFAARDPMLLCAGDHWICYYTATDDPAGGHHIVAYRTSHDLIHWSGRATAYTSRRTGTGAGDTESPFVTCHGGIYYLFIGPCGAYRDQPDGYTCTAVYRSDTPYHFAPEHLATRIPSHAAELVTNTDDTHWISHAGWGQAGVYLAPLQWHDPTSTGR